VNDAFSLANYDFFPGQSRTRDFIQSEITRRGVRTIAEIGGGANPVVAEDFIARKGLDYTVIDISDVELAKAPKAYHKVCIDVAASTERFESAVGARRFDLIFSRMVMEHISESETAQRNVFNALRPGGVAIHLFPTANNLPLFLNRLLPEWLTSVGVRILQPHRDISGHQRKFPAYYRLCMSPSPKAARAYEKFGYQVERHIGYVGHPYYICVPILRNIERGLRTLCLRAGVGMTGAAVLILRKPGLFTRTC
jgi:SAM-dependent methyltransferase